jgi:predicted transcriptional regulator
VTEKKVLGIRLAPTIRAALERAAEAEARTLSAMAQVAIADWLRRGGWLAAADKKNG